MIRKYAQKWNTLTKKYESYLLPEGSILYTEDMEEIVPCVQCASDFVSGNAYTSLEIHTSMGFGYPVCECCYNGEHERRERADESRGHDEE